MDNGDKEKGNNGSFPTMVETPEGLEADILETTTSGGQEDLPREVSFPPNVVSEEDKRRYLAILAKLPTMEEFERSSLNNLNWLPEWTADKGW